MSIVTGLAVYFLIWWTALFVVLPFGVRPAEKTDAAMAGGAPDRPDLKKKIMITSILSAAVWLVLYAILRSGYVNFVDISENMLEADLP